MYTRSPYRKISAAAKLSKDKTTAEGRPQLEHRHLAVIANIISKLPQWSNATDQRRAVAGHFTRELASTNKKFDADRFRHACNIGVYDDD